MKYRLLGRTGLRVAELCLGTMTFGEEWGFGASPQECKAIFDTYVKAGGNFLDTANHYTGGTSERILGELIRSERSRFVLATKYTLGSPGGDPNAAGNHRKSLVTSLEASLKRLGTNYIDLYWVHAWDELTPIDELMRALDDQVRAGKILYIGISDAPAWVVSRANTLADARGWTPFSAIQIQYNLAERTVERELLPMARALDLAVAAWAPLGGGVLTAKYAADGTTPEKSRFSNSAGGASAISPRSAAIAAEIAAVAKEHGSSPAQVALAWLRARPGLIIPIVGVRRQAQLQDNLGCLELALSHEQRERLDKVSAIELGFPHEFLARPFVREIVYAGMYASIINHRA